MPSPVQDLIDVPGFTQALSLGLLAASIGVLLGIQWRQGRSGLTAPVAGALVTLAICLALFDTYEAPPGLVVGLLLVTLGGYGAEVVGTSHRGAALLGAVFAVPGAALIALRADVPGGWLRLFLLVTLVAGGTLVADIDARLRALCVAPTLLAIAAAGVYVTVPDTERAVLLLGAALPLVALAWPWPLASLGRGGAYGAVGLLGWVAVVDGQGRPSSVFAAVACLGVLLIEPLARVVAPRSVLQAIPARRVYWFVAAQIAMVAVIAVSARVQLFGSGMSTVILIVGELAVALLAAAAVSRRAVRSAPDEADQADQTDQVTASA